MGITLRFMAKNNGNDNTTDDVQMINKDIMAEETF